MSKEMGTVEYGASTVTSDQFGDVYQPYIAISGFGKDNQTLVFHCDALLKTQAAAADVIQVVAMILSGKAGMHDLQVVAEGRPSEIIK